MERKIRLESLQPKLAPAFLGVSFATLQLEGRFMQPLAQ